MSLDQLVRPVPNKVIIFQQEISKTFVGYKSEHEIIIVAATCWPEIFS